jgi:indolepyruvate ferredoxin oxidoreductase beta subunit
VIYATKILAQAALARGERVIVSENHGMSQRGGSVLAHVKIGGSESPLIRRGTADALIAFDRTEALRNLTFARPGGYVFVNSSQPYEPVLLERLQELNIGIRMIDVEACLHELGTAAVTNLVVLGFAIAQAAWPLTLDDLVAAVHVLGPARAAALNERALGRGHATPNLLNDLADETV